jgi:hypothetical protein
VIWGQRRPSVSKGRCLAGRRGVQAEDRAWLGPGRGRWPPGRKTRPGHRWGLVPKATSPGTGKARPGVRGSSWRPSVHLSICRSTTCLPISCLCTDYLSILHDWSVCLPIVCLSVSHLSLSSVCLYHVCLSVSIMSVCLSCLSLPSVSLSLSLSIMSVCPSPHLTFWDTGLVREAPLAAWSGGRLAGSRCPSRVPSPQGHGMTCL